MTGWMWETPSQIGGSTMADPTDHVVLSDTTVDTPNHEGTKITASLRRWPDPRPQLLIDIHYCSGHGNIYWEDDDYTNQVLLSADGTAVVAGGLGGEADHVIDAILAYHVDYPGKALAKIRQICETNHLAYDTTSGDAREEIAGRMSTVRHGDHAISDTAFATPGPAKEALLAALCEDMRCDRGICKAAERLAFLAHTGQTDQAGHEYVWHAMLVAAGVKEAGGSQEAVAAAWLHDTVEDTWVTGNFLVEAGFPEAVVDAVDAVTKRHGEPVDEYAHRIAANPLAVMVKKADLADNTNPDRLAQLEPATRTRLETKYATFTAVLDSCIEARNT
ncbi:MAG: HD domain-containing protein [Propionibacteriaceae bacterium]|nr:HD domain-containing protein [Propionibacteriaceae bacterium]